MSEIEKQLSEDLKYLFGEQAKQVQEDFEYWKKIVYELRVSMLGENQEELEKLKKTEQYAWRAIYSAIAQQGIHLERTAWEILEKFLRVLRSVLLS